MVGHHRADSNTTNEGGCFRQPDTALRMDKTIFGAVGRFVDEQFAPNDPTLAAALGDAEEAGLPGIHISAGQAKLLQILAAALGARRMPVD